MKQLLWKWVARFCCSCQNRSFGCPNVTFNRQRAYQASSISKQRNLISLSKIHFSSIKLYWTAQCLNTSSTLKEKGPFIRAFSHLCTMFSLFICIVELKLYIETINRKSSSLASFNLRCTRGSAQNMPSTYFLFRATVYVYLNVLQNVSNGLALLEDILNLFTKRSKVMTKKWLRNLNSRRQDWVADCGATSSS